MWSFRAEIFNLEESLQTIKSSIPNYYTLTKDILRPKYSWKLGKKDISIINWGVGYQDVVLKIQFEEYENDTIKLIGVFKNDFILRAIIQIASLIMIFGSILFIIGIIKGKVPITLPNVGMPLLVFSLAILYLFYTEAKRKREQEKILLLVRDIFSEKTVKI